MCNVKSPKVILASLCVMGTIYITLIIHEPQPQPQQPHLSIKGNISRKSVVTELTRNDSGKSGEWNSSFVQSFQWKNSAGTIPTTKKPDLTSLCKEEYLSQLEARPVNSIHRRPKATGSMTNMEKVHKKRIERLEAVCEEYKYLRIGYSPRVNSHSFLFDMKNGLTYCRILKVIINIHKLWHCDSPVIKYISQSGSSTLFGHLKRLTGLSDVCVWGILKLNMIWVFIEEYAICYWSRTKMILTST